MENIYDNVLYYHITEIIGIIVNARSKNKDVSREGKGSITVAFYMYRDPRLRLYFGCR